MQNKVNVEKQRTKHKRRLNRNVLADLGVLVISSSLSSELSASFCETIFVDSLADLSSEMENNKNN